MDYKSQNISYWTKNAAGRSGICKDELAGRQHTIWKLELCGQIESVFTVCDKGSIKVLDAGCESGFFSIILAEAGYRVTGADYTQAMLDEARANAGDLAHRIDFCLTDVQKTAFEDASFDVIVTRNLTWNLPDPKAAYTEWLRILAPGGLLLNYDADWYSHLFNKEAERGAGFVEAGDDELPEIARQTPLLQVKRPAWDARVLKELGASGVETDLNAWKRVFSAEEKISCADAPMFLVKATK